MAETMIGFKVEERKKQLAIVIAAGFIFTVIGWLLAAQPVVVQIQFSRELVLAAKERSKLISKINELKLKRADLEKSLTRGKDRYVLLGRVTTLADENGLNVQSLVPTNATRGYYSKLTVLVKTLATFRAFLHFLEVLEISEPNLLLAAVAVHNQPPQADQNKLGGGTLEIDLALETYL